MGFDAEKIKLGKNIARLRKKAGKSKQSVADFFEVTWDAVNKWEKGFSSPPANKIPKLAQFFGVPVSALYEEEPVREWRFAAEVETGQHGEQHSEERAYYIWERECAEMNFAGSFDRTEHQPQIRAYLKGELSDGQLAEEARKWVINCMKDIINFYSKEF